MHARPAVCALACLLALAGLAGCVRRTITITSDPAGALVWLNDREIGRTPVTVDFVHYGVYDVRLMKDGYEPLLTRGDAKPPLWDTIGIDLLAEAVPGEPQSRIEWHYELSPRQADPESLEQRAEALRAHLRETTPPPAGPETENAGPESP